MEGVGRARCAWQRSVSVSSSEESVELEESLSETCEVEKAREKKELWGTGTGGGEGEGD